MPSLTTRGSHFRILAGRPPPLPSHRALGLWLEQMPCHSSKGCFLTEQQALTLSCLAGDRKAAWRAGHRRFLLLPCQACPCGQSFSLECGGQGVCSLQLMAVAYDHCVAAGRSMHVVLSFCLKPRDSSVSSSCLLFSLLAALNTLPGLMAHPSSPVCQP